MNDEVDRNSQAQARVFQINASPGGVPKMPRPRAEITVMGVVGDKQRETDVHGGPDRALCLFSLERILAMQSEGHPIFPGAMGENLTLSGIDWQALEPGVCLRLGDRVLIEVTSYTNPCSNVRDYFAGGDYSRVSQKRNPGWSRVYARVLEPGEISVGDVVQLIRQAEPTG